MTTDDQSDLATEEETKPEEPRYIVQPRLIEEQGRSISLVFGERMCEAALAKLKTPDALQTITFKVLRKLMKDNCGGQVGFLEPQQPVLETAIRVLLSSKADELSLSEIHDELSDLWMTAPWPRHITAEALQRVLDNAMHYGIMRAKT
jgi:hypothetical protein